MMAFAGKSRGPAIDILNCSRPSAMGMYQLAPAGTPIGLADLAGGLFMRGSAEEVLGSVRRDLCRRYSVRHCHFISTGRAAFSVIVQALRELAPEGRDEVVVPSYTCYSVPASVARAGLKVRVVDVDPQTLDYDYDALEQADFTRVLAVASANLYGLPNDLPRLAAIAHRHHAFVLDDAAQSMEARVGGGWSGTLGDVGFFSLDKGKNITTVDGGIVVTNRDDIGALLEARIERLPQPSARTRLACLAKLFVYSGFLRPRLYWIPESLPFLGLGTTPYPDDIRLEAYPAFLAGVGRRLFARIGELTAVRVRNATLAMERLARLPSLQFVQVVAGASPVYLRLPVFVKGNDRDRAIAALKASGIGASASFPTSVVDIPGIDPGLFRGPLRAEGGRRVARHILTLPTHPYVDASSLERAARILSKCTAG